MPNPRRGSDGYAYRKLAEQVRSLGLPCARCGEAIDYSVTGRDNQRHPLGFTLDHKVPISKGGDLLDPANATAMHRRCNTSKGARLPQDVPNQSRSW